MMRRELDMQMPPAPPEPARPESQGRRRRRRGCAPNATRHEHAHERDEDREWEPDPYETPHDLHPDQIAAYHDARRRAHAKTVMFRKLGQCGITCAIIAFFSLRAATIVGVIWGLSLAGEYARRVVEPGLRDRWVRREVERELGRTAPRQRRKIEEEQTRRIEELSASIAHEIRNPITAARSLVQQMGEDPASGDNVGYAEVALEELGRVENSISHLLRYAREEDVQLEPIGMADVIDSALETLRDRIERRQVEIRTEIDSPGHMQGDPEKLRRVLINLIGNALDALEDAGVERPRIAIQAGESLSGADVWVRVRDNGPGMDAERLERIFSPFYTSKESGTGLGLAISKKLVDAHGGSIEAHSREGAGAEFVLTFPKEGATRT